MENQKTRIINPLTEGKVKTTFGKIKPGTRVPETPPPPALNPKQKNSAKP